MLTLREFAKAEKNSDDCFVFIDDDLVDRYNEYFRDNAQIGDGATLNLWTDRHAYTIIARTPQTLTLQRCIAKRTDNNGMSECQDYKYEDNPNGGIIKAHWSKKDKVFKHSGMTVTYGRHEYWDYSF